jgi:superfamily II DNA or RNA helicase/HKD family nuclease/SOS-response transcriptional repressor LexA
VGKHHPFEVVDHLVAGGDSDPFLPKLLSAINNATEIDIAVAFVQSTGLRLLYDALVDALGAGARVRFLTGDYLYVTDPEALRTLLLLHEMGADTRIFESAGKSFHMKAYLFVKSVCGSPVAGRAFVGSSNISRSALTYGLEWNLRVDMHENPSRFAELQEKFERLYCDPRTQEITNSWIDAYVKRRPTSEGFDIQPGTDQKALPPVPNHIQNEALRLLAETRDYGNSRGLVVMATGTGKTWLAAFDSYALRAEKVLFVAHREEILKQAEETFIRIRPEASIGHYSGSEKTMDTDLLFASVQTLGKLGHLRRFSEDHFDYIVVDEFHHAAARTYQKLLAHFSPKFLLGLTATPDRTDQADILALCDDNLVVQKDLFDSIRMSLLCPFDYYGIADRNVDYKEIPWRNGKFDPVKLENKLATAARANHVLGEWQSRKQSKTLAFCVSIKHADFMAEHFNRAGIPAVAVHNRSEVRRNTALRMLRDGEIQVLFSVDLFNEGIDVPSIDTVLMLRPTESKILFLQQLGRGLRIHQGKNHLTVLDFIGNHISFFNKFEALFKIDKTNRARREFLEKVEVGSLEMPSGCYMNYDLESIEFMKNLMKTNTDTQKDFYFSLKDSLGRRPTLSEHFLAGGGVSALRSEYGGWFNFLEAQGEIEPGFIDVLGSHSGFLSELESSAMSKSYKMILMEAFIDLDGFSRSPSVEDLCRRSYKVMSRRIKCQADLPERFKGGFERYNVIEKRWITYWNSNPISAWTGDKRRSGETSFSLAGNRFIYRGEVATEQVADLESMALEIVNFKYEQYLSRRTQVTGPAHIDAESSNLIKVPFFSDLQIACGHFKSSSHDLDTLYYKTLPMSYGNLNPARHFIARASGNSMNGGKSPIRDGDYLLLDLVTPESAGSISNQLVVVEKQDETGDDQYLLRYVKKLGTGHYILQAWNDDYPDMPATEDMVTRARVKQVIDPLDLILHTRSKTREIPGLFGLGYNQGNWQAGHVCPKEHPDQFLLVTLNKQGQQESHKYHDYFIDDRTFHWQSQRSTKPGSKRGMGVINHRRNGSRIHLFLRKNKMMGGKAAPYIYLGTADYQSHSGSEPMDVVFSLANPISKEVAAELEIQGAEV